MTKPNRNDDADYPCAQHEAELAGIRDMANLIGRELAVVQEVLKRHDKSLFGNGEAGLISRLQAKDDALDARVDAVNLRVDGVEKTIIKWGAVFATILAVMQFLSGSGVWSLKGLTGK